MLAPEVSDDFDRFFDPMARFEGTGSPGRIEEIVQSLQVLTLSPLIGRPAKSDKRELVIGHGSRVRRASALWQISTPSSFLPYAANASEASSAGADVCTLLRRTGCLAKASEERACAYISRRMGALRQLTGPRSRAIR